MTAGRSFLVPILLVALICTSFVAVIRAQDDGEEPINQASGDENTTEPSEIAESQDVELPIGLELAARFHEIVEDHKAQIRSIIQEFKFNNCRTHEERLAVIEAYHNECRARLEEMKTQKEDLYDLLGKGTIDLDEFVARLRLLHAQLKGKKKIAERLGWQISEVAKTAAKQHKDKASKLKGLNQMIRDEMKTALEELKETVKGHGRGRWTSVTTDRTTTSTSNKGRGRGKGGKNHSPGIEAGEEP